MFTVSGTFNITDTIKKPMEIHIITRKCDVKSNGCEFNSESRIPGVCTLLMDSPFMKSPIANDIVPRFKCPVEKGHYTINTTVPLQQFTKFPIDTSKKWKVRLALYENLSSTKSRLIACIDGLIRIMLQSNREG